MRSQASLAVLNPEGYPLQEAFQSFDQYAAMQNGEPQMMTFGDSISHYAFVNKSKPGAILPNRKPMFIGSYGSFEEMSTDLRAQAETDLELDPEKQSIIKMLEIFNEGRQEPLPLTSAQEMELEAFELSCLGLDEIRDAARERAGQQTSDDIPSLIIVNAATGESKAVTLDAATLIAEGRLELERRREKRDGSNDVTVKTDALFGKFLAGEAAEIGVDAENAAVVGPRRRKPSLYSSRSIFDDSVRSIWGFDRPVSNDIWTEDGEYSAADADLSSATAPPRHSLSDALNYRRVDGYGAEDFLDAAQDMINTQLDAIQRFAGKKLILQPMDSFEISFDRLLQSMAGYRLAISELGYHAYSGRGGISPFFFRGFVTAFRRSGTIDRTLSAPDEVPVRVNLEQALRESTRLNTPLPIRAGRLLVQTFQRS